MKKLMIAFALLTSISAFAGQYQDGTYRGVYISGQETQVEIQFDLRNDVISGAKYRTLYYKGHDWLKEDEYVAKNGGYLQTLKDIDGKKVQDILPTLYNTKEIETAGATVRKVKVRSAIQYALNLGPFKLPKTK